MDDFTPFPTLNLCVFYRKIGNLCVFLGRNLIFYSKSDFSFFIENRLSPLKNKGVFLNVSRGKNCQNVSKIFHKIILTIFDSHFFIFVCNAGLYM